MLNLVNRDFLSIIVLALILCACGGSNSDSNALPVEGFYVVTNGEAPLVHLSKVNSTTMMGRVLIPVEHKLEFIDEALVTKDELHIYCKDEKKGKVGHAFMSQNSTLYYAQFNDCNGGLKSKREMLRIGSMDMFLHLRVHYTNIANQDKITNFTNHVYGRSFDKIAKRVQNSLSIDPDEINQVSKYVKIEDIRAAVKSVGGIRVSVANQDEAILNLVKLASVSPENTKYLNEILPVFLNEFIKKINEGIHEYYINKSFASLKKVEIKESIELRNETPEVVKYYTEKYANNAQVQTLFNNVLVHISSPGSLYEFYKRVTGGVGMQPLGMYMAISKIKKFMGAVVPDPMFPISIETSKLPDYKWENKTLVLSIKVKLENEDEADLAVYKKVFGSKYNIFVADSVNRETKKFQTVLAHELRHALDDNLGTIDEQFKIWLEGGKKKLVFDMVKSQADDFEGMKSSESYKTCRDSYSKIDFKSLANQSGAKVEDAKSYDEFLLNSFRRQRRFYRDYLETPHEHAAFYEMCKYLKWKNTSAAEIHNNSMVISGLRYLINTDEFLFYEKLFARETITVCIPAIPQIRQYMEGCLSEAGY